MTSTVELSEALRPSLRREQHILVVAAAIALSISVAAIRSSADFSKVASWFFGCAVLTVVAVAWYRWRTRACAALIAAVESGAVPSKVTIARFTINYLIPFGYLVGLDAGTLKNVTFGFWRRSAAERFAAALGGAVTSSVPPARIA